MGLNGEELENVREFKYGVSAFLANDEVEVEMNNRLSSGVENSGRFRLREKKRMSVHCCKSCDARGHCSCVDITRL